MKASDIAGIRARLGMIKKELAEAVGVSVKTLEQWEAGTVKPGAAALKKLKELAEWKAAPTVVRQRLFKRDRPGVRKVK